MKKGHFSTCPVCTDRSGVQGVRIIDDRSWEKTYLQCTAEVFSSVAAAKEAIEAFEVEDFRWGNGSEHPCPTHNQWASGRPYEFFDK